MVEIQYKREIVNVRRIYEVVHWKLIVKRIFRRIRFAFQWQELLSWPYESCERCGHCFRVCWSANNKKWREVYGSESGCLCVDCFIELANKRGIKLDSSSIERIEIFNPQGR